MKPHVIVGVAVCGCVKDHLVSESARSIRPQQKVSDQWGQR
jgi:hypothetical protein